MMDLSQYPWHVGFVKYRQKKTLFISDFEEEARQEYEKLKKKYKSAWVGQKLPLSVMLALTLHAQKDEIAELLNRNIPLIDRIRRANSF